MSTLITLRVTHKDPRITKVRFVQCQGVKAAEAIKKAAREKGYNVKPDYSLKMYKSNEVDYALNDIDIFFKSTTE